MRLAFFNYGCPVGPFALQLALGLAAAGMAVDFFYDEAHMPAADVKNYRRVPNLRLIRLEVPIQRPATHRECLLRLEWLQKAFHAACKAPYAVLVGIEKAGVALAAMIAETLCIPHIHWSLELYFAGNPGWMNWTPCGDFWLEAEANAHKSALAVIIQDEDRASVLRAAMGHEGRYLYLPVAINAANVQQRGGHALHDLYGIDHSRKILLCYGNNRLPADWVLTMRDSLPEPWVLVLHGLYMSGLEGVPGDSRLIVSAARRPEAEIPALIASAHAGLVYYQADDINQTLTAFASEKLARCLCAGIPVITSGIRNIHKLFAEQPCGISISEPRQIAAALRTIEKNEDMFRKTAINARRSYLFELASREVIQFFSELACEGRTPDGGASRNEAPRQ
jgi:glycosyltransferase involved in cell wall biosynthesis